MIIHAFSSVIYHIACKKTYKFIFFFYITNIEKPDTTKKTIRRISLDTFCIV